MATEPPAGVHAMITHLIATPADRGLIRTDPVSLFDRFQVEPVARPLLQTGGRDDLRAIGIHPNLLIKWLIWSGRSTLRPFPISYYFDRR